MTENNLLTSADIPTLTSERGKDYSQLFATYVALGAERSLEKLAKISGVSLDRIKRISSEYKFIERLKLIQAAVAEEYEEQNKESIEQKVDVLRASEINAFIALANQIKENPDNPPSVKLCKAVFEMARTAQGKVVGKHGIDLGGDATFHLELSDARKKPSNETESEA